MQLLAYFLADKDKGLNGGIDAGYRNDTKRGYVRVFIGASFELIP